jgi:hypothetical protein
MINRNGSYKSLSTHGIEAYIILGTFLKVMFRSIAGVFQAFLMPIKILP